MFFSVPFKNSLVFLFKPHFSLFFKKSSVFLLIAFALGYFCIKQYCNGKSYSQPW